MMEDKFLIVEAIGFWTKVGKKKKLFLGNPSLFSDAIYFAG